MHGRRDIDHIPCRDPVELLWCLHNLPLCRLLADRTMNPIEISEEKSGCSCLWMEDKGRDSFASCQTLPHVTRLFPLQNLCLYSNEERAIFFS